MNDLENIASKYITKWLSDVGNYKNPNHYAILKSIVTREYLEKQENFHEHVSILEESIKKGILDYVRKWPNLQSKRWSLMAKCLGKEKLKEHGFYSTTIKTGNAFDKTLSTIYDKLVRVENSMSHKSGKKREEASLERDIIFDHWDICRDFFEGLDPLPYDIYVAACEIHGHLRHVVISNTVYVLPENLSVTTFDLIDPPVQLSGLLYADPTPALNVINQLNKGIETVNAFNSKSNLSAMQEFFGHDSVRDINQLLNFNIETNLRLIRESRSETP